MGARGRDITAYRGMIKFLNLWIRSFAKFIKFLRRLEMKFVPGALSIKFHYKI